MTSAFQGALVELRESAGQPSYAQMHRLSRAHGVPRELAASTLHDILNGKRERLPGWEVVASFVMVCHRHAEGTGLPINGLGSVEQWQARWSAARNEQPRLHATGSYDLYGTPADEAERRTTKNVARVVHPVADGAPGGTFTAALVELRESAGQPSYAQMHRLSRAHGVPRELAASTLHDILNGKRERLPGWEVVASFVMVCHRHAEGTGLPINGLGSVEQWQARWSAARNEQPRLHATGSYDLYGTAADEAERRTTRTVARLVRLAGDGDAESAYRLAVIHVLTGESAEARYWTNAACQQQHPQAEALANDSDPIEFAANAALLYARAYERTGPGQLDIARFYYKLAANHGYPRPAEAREESLKLSIGNKATGKPSPAVRRLCEWGAILAVEPERGEEWKEALLQLIGGNGRGHALNYAAGILYAGLHSRISCWARSAAASCMGFLCWVLRSQVRTWVPPLGLLFWGGLETSQDTGVGAGIAFVIFGGINSYGLVEWLRKRWNVQVGRRIAKPEV